MPNDIVSDAHPSILVIRDSAETCFDRRTLAGEEPEGVLAEIPTQLTSVRSE